MRKIPLNYWYFVFTLLIFTGMVAAFIAKENILNSKDVFRDEQNDTYFFNPNNTFYSKLCDKIDLKFSMACVDNSLTHLNNLQPNIRISVINRESTINGVIVNIEGMQPAKVFKTIKPFEESDISLPGNITPGKIKITLVPFIVKDMEVFYCEKKTLSVLSEIGECARGR
ncbi:MAG: hypothetical protein QXK37_00735 [Candidatus Woesearchaeota archaeon]